MSPRANRWPKRLVPIGWLVDLKRISALQRKIAREIDSGGYDLCFTSNCMFFDVPSIHRYLQVPVVYYSRSTSYPVITRPDAPAGRGRTRYNPAGYVCERRLKQEKQAAIRSVGTVLTNSLFSREELFRLYRVNAVVNYPAVDTAKFYAEEGVAKQRAALGVGSLAIYKAHDFSIRSLATIPEPLRPELWIAHHFEEPGEKSYLTALAESTKVKLRFYENASTELLRQLYTTASVTLFPSIFEPLGLVPLESMACSTPVVGVAEGGTRETVLDGVTGLLTQRDPAAFGEAVLSLLDNPALAADMGRAGREYVMAKWNWDESIEQLESILAKAAKCPTQEE